MKKQLLLFAMILLPLVASAHDIEVLNADGVTFYYNYINDGTELEVTFRGDRYDSYSNEYQGNVAIPEEVTYMNRTRKVTSIGSHAFRKCSGLTSVTIPNSVTSIGSSTFSGCSGLTSVTIPNSVTSLGESAFYDCSGLTSVTIGSGVTSIGNYAFDGCSGLTSITIGSGVTSIGIDAFDGCSGLTSVTIPNSVTSIGSHAFQYCSGLTSVTIPNSVTSIGEWAFYNCSGLTSITIPNSVTSIETYTFYNCSSLTSVTIPNSVTSIGGSAFSGCSRLTSVTIPNSVTSIGGGAFSDCSGLTSVTIPNSVTSIEDYAFSYCSGLTSVTIPNSVTSIGVGAFYNCSSLTSVTIPNSVTSIGNYAFSYCSSLTSITIPNSVTSIGGNAFNGVDIPTVISLIENPFKIIGKTSNFRTFSQNTFNNATLYVPKGTIDKYKATEGWKDFLFIEEGAGGGDTPTTQKCEKPTISYENGKLTFSSATDGAVCQYSITDTDIKAGSGNEVQLGVTYNISVYATKSGYDNSDVATATLCWIDASPKTEGITNGVAQIAARPVLVKTDNGFITVEGVEDRTNVSVYTTDGKQVGSAISQNNTASIATSIQPGSIAIVKVGEKSVKVVVK